MASAPLDDLSALHAREDASATAALAKQAILAQLVANETLVWHQAAYVGPASGAGIEEDGPPSGWQVMVVLVTLMSVGFVGLFWYQLWGSGWLLLAPLGMGVLFWSIICIPILRLYFQQQKKQPQNQHYYGLSSHALYVVQHGKVLQRYDLRHLQHLKAVPPPNQQKRVLYQGELQFTYAAKALEPPRAVELKGMPEPEWLATTIADHQAFLKDD